MATSRLPLCDIAHAEVGELVLLFLKRTADPEMMTISHLGRGRLLIRGAEGNRSVDVPDGVELAPTTKVSTRLEAFTFELPLALLEPGRRGSELLTLKVPVRSVELDLLRRLVKGDVQSGEGGLRITQTDASSRPIDGENRQGPSDE
jgi:hypothetical protein